MGAVFSRTEGFTTIPSLIGAFAFHTVCMFGGGFFIFSSVKKAQVKEEKAEPAVQAQ